MSGIKVAQVAVAETAFHFDKLYDYFLPLDMIGRAEKGMRVMVPFGRGNAKRQGIIVNIIDGSDIEKIKPVLSITDKTPVLTEEMQKLGIWLKEYAFCTYFDSFRAMLPAGTSMRIVTKYSANLNLEPSDIEALHLNQKEKDLLKMMLKSQAVVEKDKLLEIMGPDSGSGILDKLTKKGYLIKHDDAAKRVHDATMKMARLTKEFQNGELEVKLTGKQNAVAEFLNQLESASVKEICYFLGVTVSVISALTKKKVLELFDAETYRTPYQSEFTQTDTADILLTPDQKRAYDSLISQYKEGKGSGALLYGVTGSGKTKVYLKLIDQVIADKKGVIVMVPEISLTPQTLSIFHARYGGKVAVFHSALSLGQRMDEWKRVKNGDAQIAIGTRSAVFAPFKRLGLIIMDEEQEATYKSEAAPRFHARDVARFRAAYHNTLLLLASATPSISTYSNAKAGKYSFNVLNNRYADATLPEVVTLDMRTERLAENSKEISETLFDYLKENLKKGEQSILLLNRRGYNTFVACRSCGKVLVCPSCSISMTYHSANNRLMCHYCGHSTEFKEECPECSQKHMRYSGAGTQKVEDELSKLLPAAKILRMDADSTSARLSHENKLKAFKDHEYDIMIGTQMVAKGLDFKNVTLVGVLNADNAMYAGDYRSLEQSFSLLTQVVGRAGRGEKKGKAVIQTFTPENPVIRLAANQDYNAFYELEIQSRKLLIYPPYCELCVVSFIGENEENVKKASVYFFEALKADLNSDQYSEKMIILGPSPAAVTKINNKYRYLLTIKCHNNIKFRKLVSKHLISTGQKPQFKNTTVFADINPYYF